MGPESYGVIIKISIHIQFYIVVVGPAVLLIMCTDRQYTKPVYDVSNHVKTNKQNIFPSTLTSKHRNLSVSNVIIMSLVGIVKRKKVIYIKRKKSN